MAGIAVVLQYAAGTKQTAEVCAVGSAEAAELNHWIALGTMFSERVVDIEVKAHDTIPVGRHQDGRGHRSSWLRSPASGFAGPVGLCVMNFVKSMVWMAVMQCSKLPQDLALEIEDKEQYSKSAADAVVAS